MVLTRHCVALAVMLAASGATSAPAQIGPAGPRPLLFGFALECTRCESSDAPARGVGRGRLARWRYTEYPKIVDVAEGGPADRAGIKVGDVLLDIDGRSVISEEGADRFAALRTGDTVRLTVARGSKSIEVSMTLGHLAGTGRLGAGRGRGFIETNAGRGVLGMRGRGFTPDDRPRYSGRAGQTTVEVWSDTPVTVTTDSSGATVLRIGNTRVRLRPK